MICHHECIRGSPCVQLWGVQALVSETLLIVGAVWVEVEGTGLHKGHGCLLTLACWCFCSQVHTPSTTRRMTNLTSPAMGAGAEYRAARDLWLSPQSRLLADPPEGADFVYDGQGHRLILPEGLHEGEALPLIIVGGGKSLQLKDVKLVHAASLPACIQLGSGAHLLDNLLEFFALEYHHERRHQGYSQFEPASCIKRCAMLQQGVRGCSTSCVP